MLNHVIRIGPAWIRRPLLVLVMPLSYLGSILVALATRRGREAMTQERFWVLPIYIAMAAWSGYFVPRP